MNRRMVSTQLMSYLLMLVFLLVTVSCNNSDDAVSAITAHRVYVGNFNGDSVSVIDSNTDTVIATINLSHKGGCVAVLSALNRLYVTGVITDELTIINTLTNAVITTINLPGRAGSIVADSTTNRIFVAEHGDTDGLLPLGTRVWVLDGSSYDLLNTITVGTNIQDLAIDTTNRIVFITDFGSSYKVAGPVFPINADTYAVGTSIICGILPHGDGIDSTIHRAYVTNLTDTNVTVIMKWYRASGHLEKSDIETKLLEVRYDNKEKELFEAI